MATDLMGQDSIDPVKDDPRSVDELVAAALSEADEHLRWDIIYALQARGTREVLDRAITLGRSFCGFERQIGADILGQNLVPHCHCAEECLGALLGMLALERDADVLVSILSALGHLKRPEAIGPTRAFLSHADPDVRFAVVFALLTHEDEHAIAGLIQLSRDLDADVRNWATFGLGSMVEVDTPELRQALVERLSDDDGDTMAEAMIGLAQRKDPRVLPTIQAELASHSIGTMVVEAARLLGDPLLGDHG